jgi:hypothetical protein
MVFAAASSAAGIYQQTKDGKTLVWNDEPKPGDIATWSGKRDRDGYATGFGTLTWYTMRQSGGETKETVYASFFGNMIRGKLDGPVNGHSQGVTNHAIFTEGKRTTRWAGGPVRSWRVRRQLPDVADEPVAVARVEEKKPAEFQSPPPSYEARRPARPAPDYNAIPRRPNEQNEDVPAEEPSAPRQSRSASTLADRSPRNGPKLDIDDSLRSLTGPPPSLGTMMPASSHSPDKTAGSPGARLEKGDTAGLADAAAAAKGYDINQYQRTDPHFDEIDRTWSVSYELKSESGVSAAKSFTVAIDDKTGRTAVVGRR